MAEFQSPTGTTVEIPYLLRVKEVTPLVVCFLDRYWGHLEHWKSNEFSYPCGLDDCGACRRRQLLYFYAYSPVMGYDEIHRVWRPAVVQLTAAAEEVVRGQSLRGQVWMLKRLPGKEGRNKVVPRFMEMRDLTTLPPSFSIEPTLRKTFGPIKLHLNATNPFETVAPVELWDAPCPVGCEIAPPPVEKPAEEDFETIRKRTEKATMQQRFQEEKKKGGKP